MTKKDIMELLLQVFTEREIFILELKMYNAVSAQVGNFYGENNVILEKLGGMPVLSTEIDLDE